MIAIVWIQIQGLWKAWQEKIPGARLHARVVALFSVIALLETLLSFVIASASEEVVERVDKFHERRKQLGMYWDEKGPVR